MSSMTFRSGRRCMGGHALLNMFRNLGAFGHERESQAGRRDRRRERIHRSSSGGGLRGGRIRTAAHRACCRHPVGRRRCDRPSSRRRGCRDQPGGQIGELPVHRPKSSRDPRVEAHHDARLATGDRTGADPAPRLAERLDGHHLPALDGSAEHRSRRGTRFGVLRGCRDRLGAGASRGLSPRHSPCRAAHGHRHRRWARDADAADVGALRTGRDPVRRLVPAASALPRHRDTSHRPAHRALVPHPRTAEVQLGAHR